MTVDLSEVEAEADVVLTAWTLRFADDALASFAQKQARWEAELEEWEAAPPPRRLELTDCTPQNEFWREAPHLWSFTALAVPTRARTRYPGHEGRADATGSGAAAERFYELTGRAPVVYGDHRFGISYGQWVGWWNDDAGFHVSAVTVARPYVGEDVSIGHRPTKLASGEIGSEWIGELSLLGPRLGAFVGAVVETVEAFAGMAADVRWVGELTPMAAS